jgi:hypothetical protein
VPSRRPWPRAFGWLYAAAWLAYLTIFAAGFVANGAAVGAAFRGGVATLLPEALLGLLLLHVPRRLPWPAAGAGPRFAAAHLGLLLAYVAASAAGWLLLWALDRGLTEGVWEIPTDLRAMPFRVLTEMLVYGTLVGLGYAWRHAELGRELAARAARAEALSARAQLHALRSQLNPHFILNTFHALVGLVRRDPAVAEEALERLGDLLRHGLRVQREGIDTLPLADELAFVRRYLDLERLRLGERLRVAIDVDPAALGDEVPVFALQTLVENAVRHGVAPAAAGGDVRVTATGRDGTLRLAVENELPGAGARGSGDPGDRARPGEGGVGLRLLGERLEALYGGRARLTAEPSGERWRSELAVPRRAGER